MSDMQLGLDSGEPLSVRRFGGRRVGLESLLRLRVGTFENPTIDLDALVGRPASLRVAHGTRLVLGGGNRTWAGVCSHAEQLQAESTGLSTHHLRIVPKLYLLTQRTNYRVFQHLSIPDIVESLLWEAGEPHEWRVEHAVSTRSSSSRFSTARSTTRSSVACSRRLVSPSPSSTENRAAPSSYWMTRCRRVRSGHCCRTRTIRIRRRSGSSSRRFDSRTIARPGAFTLRDFDFRNPGYPLFAEAPKARGPEAAHEQYQYRPGEAKPSNRTRAAIPPSPTTKGSRATWRAMETSKRRARSRPPAWAGATSRSTATRSTSVQARSFESVCIRINS